MYLKPTSDMAVFDSDSEVRGMEIDDYANCDCTCILPKVNEFGKFYFSKLLNLSIMPLMISRMPSSCRSFLSKHTL